MLFGQVPPPPVPYAQSPSAAVEVPADPQAQREWLLAHLIVDMQLQGKYDAQKYQEIQRMLNNASDSQIAALASYYQERKAQVEASQMAQAQANLRSMEAYRNRLKVEVERRRAVYQQEQAIMSYGSALAAQQAQWAMQNVYAAQAWPYYAQPWPYTVYRPYLGPDQHHHHHHR